MAVGNRASGFSLLELLVVIAIVAIATTGVSLALRDSGRIALEREGERLAALLESARAQSRVNGIAVRWQVTPAGFAFKGLSEDALPVHWLATGIRAQAQDAQGRAISALTLGPDPIIAAQQVQLSTGTAPAQSVTVSTDGLHPFTLQ
ncbi:MAG: prepilin-type N-terminal cleavage/methylation domain-containing protein [Zoogloeaceae bacterium]|nr:prepilin-type N-terminal cleavage/methylation domain-containing protein [Zoogloeaceae bacterium]